MRNEVNVKISDSESFTRWLIVTRVRGCEAKQVKGHKLWEGARAGGHKGGRVQGQEGPCVFQNVFAYNFLNNGPIFNLLGLLE